MLIEKKFRTFFVVVVVVVVVVLVVVFQCKNCHMIRENSVHDLHDRSPRGHGKTQ